MNLRHTAAGIAAVLLIASHVAAEIRTETVEYRDGDEVMEGFVAWDDSTDARRPGVLVIHEWYGLNDYARLRTRQLARLGYVAFAADMYGKGRRATNAKEAAELSGRLKEDIELMRRRGRLALEQLREHRLSDDDKLAAIGFCFGGTSVLELARSGADFRAAVSFHGGLYTPGVSDAENIRPAILVCHGADDPHVPPKEVRAFIEEMQAGEVGDWQLNMYGGAVHSFTNPGSGDDPSSGAAFNARAERRAWKAMKMLFAETIGLPKPAGDGDKGIVDYTKKYVVRPVGKAGKTTGEAVKKAAEWSWDKVTGDDQEEPEAE